MSYVCFFLFCVRTLISEYLVWIALWNLGSRKHYLSFFIIQIKMIFEPFLLGLLKNLMSVVIGILLHCCIRAHTPMHTRCMLQGLNGPGSTRRGLVLSCRHGHQGFFCLLCQGWSGASLLGSVRVCEGLSEVPAHSPCPCRQAPWCQPRAACSRARILIMVTLLRGLKALWK